MYILSSKNKSKVIDMFQHTYHIPALAVLSDEYPGRIYVDSLEAPTCSMIWVADGWCYFGSNGIKDTVKPFLQAFFSRELPELMRQIGDKFCEVYGLEEYAEDYSQFKLVEKHKEVIALLPEEYEMHSDDVPKQIKIKTRVIQTSKRSVGRQMNIMRNIYEVWDQEKYVAKSEDLGIRHKNMYLVNTHTFNKEDRHHGYATFGLQTMINEKLKNGERPVWETRADNQASISLAEHLGFVKEEEYEVAMFQWR